MNMNDFYEEERTQEPDPITDFDDANHLELYPEVEDAYEVDAADVVDQVSELSSDLLETKEEEPTAEEPILESVSELMVEPIGPHFGQESMLALKSDVRVHYFEPVVEPVAVEPAVEEPVVETIVEEPVVEETIMEPVVEEPVVEEPVVEETIMEPLAEPVVEEPVVEETIMEPLAEPVVEEPVVEESLVEPVVEEPVIEESIMEPVVEDALHQVIDISSFIAETKEETDVAPLSETNSETTVQILSNVKDTPLIDAIAPLIEEHNKKSKWRCFWDNLWS